eukprot:6958847-Pyramimonas_sp.AAC.1
MSGGRVLVESDRDRGRVGNGACAVRQSQEPIPRQCQNKDPRRQRTAAAHHLHDRPPPTHPEQRAQYCPHPLFPHGTHCITGGS